MFFRFRHFRRSPTDHDYIIVNYNYFLILSPKFFFLFYHHEGPIVAVVDRQAVDVDGDVVGVGAVEAGLDHVLPDVELEELRDVVQQSQDDDRQNKRST